MRMEKKRGNEKMVGESRNGGNKGREDKNREDNNRGNKSNGYKSNGYKSSGYKSRGSEGGENKSGGKKGGENKSGGNKSGEYKSGRNKSREDKNRGSINSGNNYGGEKRRNEAERNSEGKSVRGRFPDENFAAGRSVSGKDREGKQAAGKRNTEERSGRRETKCPHEKKCGSCRYLYLTYEEQLKKKEIFVRQELEKCPELKGHFKPILGMENPWNYRNKVTAVFDRDRKGNPISGVYEEGTHNVIPVERCLIEDELADRIIGTIRGMLKSFKIKVYDEDTRYGLLRYVLVRRAFATGEVMVVLVTASPVLPSKRNFTNALLKAHPEITTVIQNVNTRTDSLILGDKQQVLYGKGYIEDVLCGCRFRISPASFYQINPVQTEKLYGKAIELAGLKGTETVIDAYCGIGTIGLIAASHAKNVISVELNPDAVKDAVMNAKINGIKNVRFYKADAGQFLTQMAEEGAKADVLLMDPPRSGSTEEFLHSAALLGPEKIVYISCNPVTLGRDLLVLRKLGYRAEEVWPVDMFPWSGHIECVVGIQRKHI